MTYILNPTSIIFSTYRAKYKFSGSSRYGVIDDEIVEKPGNEILHNTDAKKKKSIKKETKEMDNICEKKEEKKIYMLNKSKVKKKCYALSRLPKSKKFLAFYSISFPVNLLDQVCYKLFNIWLTRCRKTGGLNTYLWVTERQKNGTIHFHLLTNDFMEIKTVNGFMAKALKTEKKNGNDALKEANTEVYNGVDVRRVGDNRKSLLGYLIKYVAKNNIEFYRLPWHCSRDISRLFTSINFDEPDDKKYFDKLPRIEDESKIEDKYRIIKTDNYNCAGFKFIPDEGLYVELDSVNETIYNEYNEQKLKARERSKNENG